MAALDTGSRRWVFPADGAWGRTAASAFMLFVATIMLLFGVLGLTSRGRRFFDRHGSASW